MTGSNSPSSTAQLPLPTRSSCTSPAAATAPRADRRRAAATPPPLTEAVRTALREAGQPLSRSPSANSCASTTHVSVSPSNLSNSAVSPSAAPPVGTCRPDAHRPLPPRLPPTSVPRSSVPHQAHARDGTATAHTPCHLSSNEPGLGARNATRGLRRLPLTSACCSVRSRRCRQAMSP